MNKLSKGLVTLAATTSIALAGTTTAAAQSSLPGGGQKMDPINVTVGPWPDYGKMSADNNKKVNQGKTGALDASSKQSGLSRDDTAIVAGVLGTFAAVALLAGGYQLASQAGIVPPVKLDAILPQVKLPQMPKLPTPAQLSS